MILLGRHHIRTRLTVYLVAALAMVLLVYISAESLLLLRDLHKQSFWHAIQDLETVEGLLFFDANGHLQVREDYHNHPESKRVLERMLEVRDPDGRVLYRNELLGSRSLGDALLPSEGEGGYSERELTLADGTRVDLVSRRHSVEGRPTIIRVAFSQQALWSQFRADVLALLLPLPLVLLLTAVAGYRVVSRLLQPIQALARRAAEISGERLHERLPVDRRDGELADLALTFNSVLERLEQSFERLRRFTSDASHELRTPLAAIRSVGEVSLQKKHTPEGYRDVIGSMLEEANRLTRLVDSLLTIARADAGQIPMHWSVFRVDDLVRQCVSLFEVLLEEKQLTLSVEGVSTEDLAVRGDWVLLRQCLLNVLHNAIKYAPVSGRIEMRVLRDSRNAVIEVEDNGPGIPPEKLERIFDRFYRADDGRSREQGGAGLGLAIARWTVETHGGSIIAEAGTEGGCLIRITLPEAAALPEVPAPVFANEAH